MTTPPRLRTIAMHHDPSVSSWVATVEEDLEPSKIRFADSQVYANQPEKAREAFDDTVKYFASTGLNAAGADSVELALVFFYHILPVLESDSMSSGGFHKSPSDHEPHLTGTVRDANNN